jgi:hypothetical protein
MHRLVHDNIPHISMEHRYEEHRFFPVEDVPGSLGANNFLGLRNNYPTRRVTDDDLPYCWIPLNIQRVLVTRRRYGFLRNATAESHDRHGIAKHLHVGRLLIGQTCSATDIVVWLPQCG